MDSKTVFELRKEAKNLSGSSKLNKLLEALDMAQQLYSIDAFDEWTQKALAYTLIDLCKYYITNRNLSQASIYFQELLSIEFQCEDEIIENQKNFLRSRVDANFIEIQQADELSKKRTGKTSIGHYSLND